jgi:hypothetical protein
MNGGTVSVYGAPLGRPRPEDFPVQSVRTLLEPQG